MANLKEIRIRLNSVKSTRQITSAMKMVSAAKLRKAQDAILQLRPFYTKLHEVITRVSSSLDEDHENVFSRTTDAGRILLVVITSNRGLCGAFNTNVVKRTIQCITEQYPEAYKAGKLDIITIGKKGADQLRGKNYKNTASYHHLFDKLNFEQATQLADQIISDFVQEKYGIVKLIYNQFKNAAVQELSEEFMLPVLPDTALDNKYESHTDYIYEPSEGEILNEMIPYSLRVQFFRALLESNAAEHGARMTAMHKATDNATDLIRDLELTYNKARQASITNEILEIVGGANALQD
jgi:F-type H+-transporting ATPase subunit gamma